MRTTARETLFKFIFSSQFSASADDGLKNALYKADKLDKDDIEYCNLILNYVNLHKNEIYKIIDEYSVSFPQSRIYPADKSILSLAIAEILYAEDIPDKVSINEAANIASKYSSEKSASFISGILSSVIKEKKNV